MTSRPDHELDDRWVAALRGNNRTVQADDAGWADIVSRAEAPFLALPGRAKRPRTAWLVAASVIAILGAATFVATRDGDPEQVVTNEPATAMVRRSVTGSLRLTGGRAGASAIPVPGTVSAVFGNGRSKMDVHTDDAGRFTLQLPAGTYSLTGRSPNFGNGEYLCRAHEDIVITDRDISGVLVDCPMR